VGADVLVEALLSRVTDVIALSDRESGRLIEVSDSFCTLLGYDRDELIGRTGLPPFSWTLEHWARLRAQREDGVHVGSVFEGLPSRDGRAAQEQR
jgi:PAS domain S-box-containing protein